MTWRESPPTAPLRLGKSTINHVERQEILFLNRRPNPTPPWATPFERKRPKAPRFSEIVLFPNSQLSQPSSFVSQLSIHFFLSFVRSM